MNGARARGFFATLSRRGGQGGAFGSETSLRLPYPLTPTLSLRERGQAGLEGVGVTACHRRFIRPGSKGLDA